MHHFGESQQNIIEIGNNLNKQCLALMLHLSPYSSPQNFNCNYLAKKTKKGV